MKPIGKFSNLGPSGLARRFAPKDAPVAQSVEPAAHNRLDAGSSPAGRTKASPVRKQPAKAELTDKVKRWREANPELYKERQRKYQRDYRKRRAAEKEKK